MTVLATACTSGAEVPTPAMTAPGRASSAPSGGSPGDDVRIGPGRELRADSTTMETWALLWEPSPWKPGQEVKVVWRTTGTGAFRVVAVGPSSQQVPPVTGPTQHFGSNWDRPGDEWGTVFRLDQPGRWRLQVSRGSATASLVLMVGA